MTTTIKIDLPADVLESLVAGKSFQVKPSTLPNATLVKMMEYACQRLINDRAKGDTDADKHSAAAKVVASMLDGTCADGSRGASIPVEVRAARNVAEAVFRAKASKEAIKNFNADKTSDKQKALDAIATKNATNEAFVKAVAAETKRLRAKPTIDISDLSI